MNGRYYLLLVCGGRDYRDRATAFAALDEANVEVERRGQRLYVMQGGAEGADALAREWAQDRCVPWVTFPANWRRDGKRAGRVRNQDMIDQRPASVLAFPGGAGTADMIRRAFELDVTIRRIP